MEDPNEERWGNVLLLYVPSTTIAAKKVYLHCKGANIYMTTQYFCYYAFISSSFYKQPSYYKSSLLFSVNYWFGNTSIFLFLFFVHKQLKQMRNLESMSCFTSSVTIHVVDLTDDPFKSSLHWKICKYMVTVVFEVLNALSLPSFSRPCLVLLHSNLTIGTLI